MSWIESHQRLRDHPKTALLSKNLNITKAQAIGHLHLLWWWCADYSADGSLNRYTPAQIAEAADWAGNAGEFLQQMADCGFIDRDPLRVHDWQSYRLHFDLGQSKRERNLRLIRRRVKRWRDRNAASNALVTQKTRPTYITNKTLHNKTNSTGLADSPSGVPYPLPDPKTEPKKCLVLSYKSRKGVAYDSREWDKANFARAMAAAGTLLALCKDLASAESCLNDMSAEYDAKSLSWTLETVARNAPDWLKKNGRTDANASRAGLRMAIAQRQSEKSNQGGLVKVSEGPVSLTLRDRPNPESGIKTIGEQPAGRLDEKDLD